MTRAQGVLGVRLAGRRPSLRLGVGLRACLPAASGGLVHLRPGPGSRRPARGAPPPAGRTPRRWPAAAAAGPRPLPHASTPHDHPAPARPPPAPTRRASTSTPINPRVKPARPLQPRRIEAPRRAIHGLTPQPLELGSEQDPTQRRHQAHLGEGRIDRSRRPQERRTSPGSRGTCTMSPASGSSRPCVTRVGRRARSTRALRLQVRPTSAGPTSTASSGLSSA